ncbi:MAG: hypothetical protein ORN98_07290 [Alphaproteobacteria bacterium]|nr:hypothetical protein [Alphaproteobacteria bacterium]
MSLNFCHSLSKFAQLHSNWLQISDRGIQKVPDWITHLAAPRFRVGLGFERDKRAAAGNDNRSLVHTAS